MEFKDYYKILGVTPETPVTEIKRAYRKLARQYHPDVSKLPDAEARFKEITEAWEVLQDKEKKAHYDQVRQGGWKQPSQGPHPRYEEQNFSQEGDFSDFFNSIFGGGGFSQQATHEGFRAKGRDIHAKVAIPLEVAYQGGNQTLQLQLGREIKNLNVKIPPGVINGSQIRLKEQGGKGVGDAPSGDLYIEITIHHHPFYALHHKDITLKLPITPWEAALGATLSVPTLGGL